MTRLFIHAKNSEFQSRDDGGEYDQPAEALARGVDSAVIMAADEIAQGRSHAAVEVIIERDDGRQVLRSVVAVSVSSLITNDSTIIPFPPRPVAEAVS